MPSRSRMRSAHAANIAPLTQLHHLASLNIIGFGVADVCPLSRLSDHLVTLEAGLNPLSSDSLRAIGRLQALQHLELGGESFLGGGRVEVQGWDGRVGWAGVACGWEGVDVLQR